MRLQSKVPMRPILFVVIILLLLTYFSSALAGNDEMADLADTFDQETDAAVQLPVDAETFKMEINEDGLYAVTGADLAAAGMNLASVNPDQIQMMHRGNAVAYQFVNVDGSPGFGSDDEVRFYGWEFDGSRYEDMYVSNNVFWLWGGGTSNRVQIENNEAGKGYEEITEFPESITKWPHNVFFPGFQVDWDKSPNDATPWHWATIRQPPGTPGQFVLEFDLPNPASGTGKSGTILVEVTSRFTNLSESPTSYQAKISLNQSSNGRTESWNNAANLNIVYEESMSQFLQPGANEYPTNKLNFELLTDSANVERPSTVYVTRATVDYPRELFAIGDPLIFGMTKAGNSEFHLAGFSDGATGKIVVWDISNKHRPVEIDMTANQRSASDSITAVIGRSHDANARFITTTTDNFLKPESITEYVPASLTPTNKAGTWVAVSHKTLLPADQNLAQYRAAKSKISTWVVDVEDITNRVGYKFNMPEMIRKYLTNGWKTWAEQPRYLTIFGDATYNPRQLECVVTGCDSRWDPDKPSLLPTDLLFVDRFNGLIPVDYTFGLLEGNDLRSEIAVGRVPAETLAEAQAVVQKLKRYESSFDSIQAWHKQMLFVADNADSGGSFCSESRQTAAYVPNSFKNTFLCLPETSDKAILEQATEDLREDLYDQINNKGMSFINYRGHGGIITWASPSIISVDDTSFWQNVGRPVILISADCLDGNFADVTRDGLGETFIKLGNESGSVAHWASSGLGYAFEHSVLHNAFYEGLFDLHLTAIGDAINYSKTVYLDEGNDPSEAYAFALLGDPAMTAYPVNESILLPVVIRP